MKTIRFLLINSLHAIMQLVVDHCVSFLSHFNLICWASNKDTFTSGTHGTVSRQIFYERFGKSYVRSNPSHFNIKDPAEWKKRCSKFSAYSNCAKWMNYDLQFLYQRKKLGCSWFNMLCSQLSHFWVRQMDGTYLFSPGFADISIGNGSMPNAREVIFTSSSVNTLNITFDNAVVHNGAESNNDILQLMFIDEKGEYSFWADLTDVTRSSGSASYIIPAQFGTKIYPAIKFRANTQYGGGIKGIFRFPRSLQPISILR